MSRKEAIESILVGATGAMFVMGIATIIGKFLMIVRIV